jgi:hypothetical protein
MELIKLETHDVIQTSDLKRKRKKKKKGWETEEFCQ